MSQSRLFLPIFYVSILVSGVGCASPVANVAPDYRDAQDSFNVAQDVSEPDATAPAPRCPKSAPFDNGSCDFVGLRCGYDDRLVSYLCTALMYWRKQQYAPATDASTQDAEGIEAGQADAAAQREAGRADAGQSEAGQHVLSTAICETSSMTACPTDLCRVGCCPYSRGRGDGCSGCCMPKTCNEFDPEHCPIECAVLDGCDGHPICRPKVQTPPACGGAGYYGVACCEGLMSRCGKANADGSCDPTAGGYQGMPYCLSCGDGTCETSVENHCNCPDDCP